MVTDWKPGMFYEVGGAAALYWPDQHPEHPIPGDRWLVFDPWGGLEVIMDRLPREDMTPAHEMGWAPFISPISPEDPEAARLTAVQEFWRDIRSVPDEKAVEEMRTALRQAQGLTVDHIDEPPPQ